MSISLTTTVLCAKLLDEKVAPMDRRDNAGQPDEVPAVVAYADDEDEEEDGEGLDDEEFDEEFDDDLDESEAEDVEEEEDEE